MKHPELLEPIFDEYMKPIFQCLSNLVKTGLIKFVIKEIPQCLSLNYLSDFWPKIKFFIDVGFEPSHFKVLLKRYPSVLMCSLKDEIIPAFHKTISVTGLSLTQIYLSFSRFPELLRCQIENKFDIDSMVVPNREIKNHELKKMAPEDFSDDEEI